MTLYLKLFYLHMINKKSKLSFKSNLLITENFIKYCYNKKIRFIFISTYISSANRKMDKLNLYQLSKINSENLIKKKLKNYLIIRLPNIYGEYKYRCKSINNLVDKLIYFYLCNKSISIYDNSLSRSYLFVDEFIFFLHKLINSNIIIPKTINLNIFKPISNFMIIKLFEKIIKRKISLKKHSFKGESFNYFHKNKYPSEIYEIKNKLNSYLKQNLT